LSHSVEIYYQQNLLHPNILKPIHIYKDEECVYLAFNIPQDAKLLSDLINSNDFDLDYKGSIDILLQILGIIKFLNHNGLMHRNINPDCFLVNRNLCKVWIYDLGSCCELSFSHLDIKPSTNIMFSSPEMLIKDRD